MTMTNTKISEVVKKRFLVPFQEIFAEDSEFPYNKSDASMSRLVISSKFATPKENNKLPQIIVNNVAYSTQTQTLFNNFYDEKNHYVNAPATKTGRQFKNAIYFTVGIDCMSTVKVECEHLADRVFSILNHQYVWLFQGIGMNIRSLSVNDSVFKTQYPQYEFVTSVAVQGDSFLVWEEYWSQNKENVLQHIKVLIDNDD